MFFKSIRFKVLVWYMLLLAVTLFSFSIVLYGSFSKVLVNNLDDLLSSRAEGVTDSVHTYWHDKGNTSDMAPFLNIARDWVEEKRNDPELMKVFVQILSVKAQRLVSTKSMPFIAPVPKSDLEDVLAGDDSFNSLGGVFVDGRKAKFRVYTRPVIEDGKVVYIVQAAGPIELISIASGSLMVILFILLPLTIILAGIPGVMLAGLTLKPIASMIDTLKHITAENLKLKIHIPDTKDEVRRLADTFNDMIERLDRSFSSQQNFIKDISYELKAPLFVLRGELAAVLDKPSSKEEYEAVHRKGLEEFDRFSEIIDNLIVLARFDNSQMPIEIKKVNLTQVIEEVLRCAKAAAAKKDIVLSSFLQDVIILDGDEERLKRLFTNLVDNAVKYTRRNGKVVVAAHRGKDFANITVSDTGIGIPEDELLYIFDRFYQVNKSRSGKHGFGLGLSVARSIAESHKGKITVESQPGKGSTFTVAL
ncbi:MAG: HAMP domain-containing sensor histidine kinase, partial [Candidatus Omnitrophica bacterium]|nr:HAMP domain-containing sensor histidine kinase [Candidatus Omnitrophota bacterium]